MKMHQRLICAGAFLVCILCSSLGQQVRVSEDVAIFSGPGTYDLLPGQKVSTIRIEILSQVKKHTSYIIKFTVINETKQALLIHGWRDEKNKKFYPHCEIGNVSTESNEPKKWTSLILSDLPAAQETVPPNGRKEYEIDLVRAKWQNPMPTNLFRLRCEKAASAPFDLLKDRE